MIGSAQSAHLVDSVILSRHTACLAPPNVAILRMYTSSESHFLLPAKRLALRMGVEWSISQADYNGPKQQCWLSLTNSSPILRRDKTTSKALLFITSLPNDTYKLQWSHSPIRQPTL